MSKNSSSISENQIIHLIDAVEGFEANSFAILYSPKHCYLAKFNGEKFINQNGEIDVENEKIYEARVFNAEKELRWVKGYESKTISDEELTKVNGFVDTIPQKYLLWGEVSPTNDVKNNGEWTEFAEARIGTFYVPIKTSSRACFEATEYLKEFEDGNVAVFEERLTGISEVNNDGKINI